MDKLTLYSIKMMCDTIIHGGDYGQSFINEDLNKVTLVLVDADEVDTTQLEEMLEEIDVEFEILYEVPGLRSCIKLSNGVIDHGPNDSCGCGFGDENEYDGGVYGNFPEDSEPILEPRMLSLGDYAKFLDLIERL